MKMKLMLSILGVLCLSLTAKAAPIAYEGFDYPVGGAVVGQSGGVGWGGPWALYEIDTGDSVIEVGEALPAYGTLLMTGNSLHMTCDTTVDDVGTGIDRTLTQDIGTPGTTLWGSILVSASEVSNSDFFITFAGNGALTIGKKWWDGFSIDNNFTGVAMAPDQTYLLLFCYVFGESSCSTYLWVDPDMSTEPALSTADATKIDSFTPGNTVRIRENRYENGWDATFDELRLGTAFEDVVPTGFVLVPDMYEYTSDEVIDPNSGLPVPPFATSTADLSSESVEVHQGDYSLKAVLDEGETVTKLTSGGRYDLSAQEGGRQFGFWMKGDVGNDAGDLTITFTDPNGVPNKGSVTFVDVMQDSDWQVLEFTIPENEPNDWDALYGIEMTASSVGTIYIDQMEILKPAAQLVVHWSFDEGTGTSTTDMSGNGITGTLSDLPESSWVAGRVGQEGDYAINFDGSDANSLVSATGINLKPLAVENIFADNSSWTISMWFKSNSNAGIQMIGGFGRCDWVESGEQDERYLNGWDGTLEFQPGGDNGFWPGADIPEGEWALLTVTYDKWEKRAKMYINEVLMGSKAYGSLADVSDKSIKLGGIGKVAWEYYGTQVPLNAAIDDFKLFDQALTEQQIVEMSGAWVCINKPTLDLDDDCIVNLSDFAMLASQWLDCGRFPETYCDEQFGQVFFDQS